MGTDSNNRRDFQELMITSGISMEPFVKSGAEIVQTPVRAEDIRIGDLVTFCPKPGVFFTHRIVRILRSQEGVVLLTKGDSAANLDDPVRADQVMACVTHVDGIDIRTFGWRIVGCLIAFISYGQYLVLRRLSKSFANRFRQRLIQKGLLPKVQAAVWFARMTPISWLNAMDKFRRRLMARNTR